MALLWLASGKNRLGSGRYHDATIHVGILFLRHVGSRELEELGWLAGWLAVGTQ